MTATEQVLKIIERSRKGVDVPRLKAKTGFDDKKVRNIVFRASKEGKIKKVSRGIYVGAK
jgi:predicted transcriptional regulator of viral defense system